MHSLKIVKVGICLALLFFTSCSRQEKSGSDVSKRQNAKAEYITRNFEDRFFNQPTPSPQEREPYPWEDPDGTLYPKITKEFLRCKGSPLHAAQTFDEKKYKDCEGFEKHTLPIHQDREFIYPVLLELLNYLQRKTKKKVVITCGHRCPIHNEYADSSKGNQISKHLIGAEVDFYIQGLEERPMEVIETLLQFYKDTAAYRGVVDYERFHRYRGKTDITTLPWYNKEIFVKLYKKNEGRDFDNRHPFPYICIQIRYDRDRKQAVSYTWGQAHRGYHRF